MTPAETDKLLEACPNHHWRTIVSLARYGGLRCPSEVLSLRWQDIDWNQQRINVPFPKTEHQGKESRVIPLFPELKASLEEAWELAPTGAIYVVDERHRKSANAATGWRNCNLRTTFEKIVKRAGLKAWPKLFHALRASRETELAQQFPLHVVTAWLGNTPTIAIRHYLLTTDADFECAIGKKCQAEEAVQNPVQQATEIGRKGLQRESQNCQNSKENGTLQTSAACRGGGQTIR